MAFSAPIQAAILAWVKGSAFLDPPASVYVALWNGDPLEDGSGGSEVTDTIAADGRPAVTFGDVQAASGVDSIANEGQVSFGAVLADATFSHFALFTAQTGGTLISSAALKGGEQSISAGTTLYFAAGSLTLSVD